MLQCYIRFQMTACYNATQYWLLNLQAVLIFIIRIALVYRVGLQTDTLRGGDLKGRDLTWAIFTFIFSKCPPLSWSNQNKEINTKHNYYGFAVNERMLLQINHQLVVYVDFLSHKKYCHYKQHLFTDDWQLKRIHNLDAFVFSRVTESLTACEFDSIVSLQANIY